MGISVWQLLIVLVIVILLFGTKKLKNIGGDLGASIKNFRQSMKDEGEAKKEEEETTQTAEQSKIPNENKVIEGEVTAKTTTSNNKA